MIREVPFSADFMGQIDPVWPDGVTFVQQALQFNLTEYSQAFEDDDGPLWAWGVVPLWEGVGSVWLLFDRRANRSAFRIIREAKKYAAFLEGSGFKRLQGEFHCDAPTGRLAAMLGFQREGILRNYGMKGEGDFVMVARIS